MRLAVPVGLADWDIRVGGIACGLDAIAMAE